MNHRLWDERDVQAMTSTDVANEHNTLYMEWEIERDRVQDAVEEKRFAEGQCTRLSWLAEQAEKDLIEYRQQAKANASHDEFWNVGNIMALGAREVVKRHEEDMKAVQAIRMPQYCPADVGFASRVPELEAKIKRQRNNLASVSRTIECKNADIAKLRAELAEARAAFAHIQQPARPNGLPSADELEAVFDAGRDDGMLVNTRGIEAIIAALAPYLREPTGWELAIHRDELDLYRWVTEPGGGYAYAAQQVLDLCRSRIRPVFECAETRPETRVANDVLRARIAAARAALEGE